MPKTRNGFYLWCGGVFVVGTMSKVIGATYQVAHTIMEGALWLL